MYELKKYLNINPNTLKVHMAHSVDNMGKLPMGPSKNPLVQIYHVVHFKPFVFTDDNVTEFINALFQGVINYKIRYNGRTFPSDSLEPCKNEITLTINGIVFTVTFYKNKNGSYVMFESATFCNDIPLEILGVEQNKNNFTILKRIKKEVDSFSSWKFLKSKMEEELLKSFGKKVTVAGHIKETEDEEYGQFKLTLHTDLMDKYKLSSISFSLEKKELKISSTGSRKIKYGNFNTTKDANYYRQISKDYNILANSVDKIESIVHWVIFSARREERLKQLLDTE